MNNFHILQAVYTKNGLPLKSMRNNILFIISVHCSLSSVALNAQAP